MANLEQNVKDMLKVVAGIEDFPDTAFNVRVNGECAGRENSNNIEISPKENGSGIDITVKANTKGETVYIPVVVETSGMKDLVYNDFYIGENADVKIIAGCGIHNDGHDTAQHDGIHTFHLEKNSKVLYEEKHYGEGGGTGDRVLNPETIINLKEGSYLEMETVQIEGVDSTNRITKGQLEKDAKLIVKERLMTSGKQWAKTDFVIDLDGEGSSADLISRSVAKDDSKQEFISKISGNNECAGHSAFRMRTSMLTKP